jgi:superfamily I DNA and/or RNA helicase
MDIKHYMIVDLEKRGDKRMFLTEQVATIAMNNNGFWKVRFLSSPRVFNYNHSRLLYLSNPEAIDIEEKGLYIKNKHVTDVNEVLRFTNGQYTFYHVTYNNGYYENFDSSDVYVTRTPIDKNDGSVWDYLCKLAAETGLMVEDKENILSMQYGLVDRKRDNVPLAQYLGDNTKLGKYRKPNLIYYPFGCNASQKAAVQAALTNQVSVIQGPPGTGKTQTILNIIANLLMVGKTVLVVSNNNSAVENVSEKLAGEGLGFIVAKLGSGKNKEAFIANQPELPDMSDWVTDEAAVENKVSDALNIVTTGFDCQIRQAQLKAELDALSKELKYNDMLQQVTSDCEWLRYKSSSKLISLLNFYRTMAENGQKVGLWFRLKWSFLLGIKMFSFLRAASSVVIASLESSYYYSRRMEIEKDLETTAATLQSINIEQNVKELRSSSLLSLKNKIAKRYNGNKRKKFTIKDIKPRTEDFLKEYPVVLSTTYSAKSCISKDMVFDYVIMDEASQVDIKTGALALSCAMNVVIVGDDKQLPNVIGREEAIALKAIQETYNVDDRYNAVSRSFLQSCLEVFKDAPVTLLREHYRCHPKIIGFCNKRFYDGELVTMTADNGEKNVLQVKTTGKGNHARGHFNQREIDVIVQEVMPQFADMGSVGIITPYRAQSEEINKIFGQDIASTVHKYQGRECDTIIMSTVDNMPTDFFDDANLLNVAISRAKTHLYIVTNGNEMPQDTNLAQLIAYIKYNNFDVSESKLHSVFDLLYKQYTKERLAYKAIHPDVSEYISENLVYEVLVEAIEKADLANWEVLCHYPLSRLIGDWSLLDEKEKAFAGNPLSHVDFLIYDSLTKQPRKAIEVDGWHFHRDNVTQQSRDTIKDKILSKFDLTPHRLSTTSIVNVETMIQVITSARNSGNDIKIDP